jgi:Protein of unknown function (DUF3386)
MTEQTQVAEATSVVEDPQARELMRAAYDNRYTWDAKFPGYRADVTLTKSGAGGSQVHSGKVQIQGMKNEVFEVADEDVQKEIAEQAWEIGVHRIRRPFDKTHADNKFVLGETDETGAVELLVGGKATGDRYKVRNNEVVLVHRRIHNVVVTINTFTTHQTGEGYLSHQYDSVYHDPATSVQMGGVSQFEDIYEQVEGYYVLTSRVIRTTENGETTTRSFGFANLKLLQPAAV